MVTIFKSVVLLDKEIEGKVNGLQSGRSPTTSSPNRWKTSIYDQTLRTKISLLRQCVSFIAANLGNFEGQLEFFYGSKNPKNLGIFGINLGNFWKMLGLIGEKRRLFLEGALQNFGNLCRLERQIQEISVPLKVLPCFREQQHIKESFFDVKKF